MGEPDRKLKQPAEGEEAAQEEPPAEEEEGEGGDQNSEVSEPEEITVPTRELTEIDRLRYVVCAIENDCHIAPTGAFKITSDQ